MLDTDQKNFRGSVILPIPEGIQDSNIAGWGEGNMGPIQTAAMGMANGGIEGKGFATGVSAVKIICKSRNAASQTATQRMHTNIFCQSKATKALTGSGDFNQALSRDNWSSF
jgi:hypothetical protein